MKKFLFVLSAFIVALTVSAKDTVSHDPAVLPEAARTIIKNNYKADISFIKIDKDWGRISEYEVILTDGSEVKFDSKGNWKEVESRRNTSVPSFFVLKTIRDFVSKNHPGQKIVGIDKDRKGYDVTLSNGIDIEFDTKGNFKHYDD